MLRIIIAAALMWTAGALPNHAAEPEPIRVMIVGAIHFGNPGQDLNNMRTDSVTTPAKQAELAAVADALAAFQPTMVAVERVSDDLIDPVFPTLGAADLLTNADERVQLGYRLAWRAGLDRVYAIDEQPSEGERDYFPFGAVQTWAQANGRMGEIGQANARVGGWIAELEGHQRTESMGRLLVRINDPQQPLNLTGHGLMYYGMLRMGDVADQPGAELNAAWYERNAKIFAKLLRVAQPGDRVVVVYGLGHAYWLRHFVQTMPGFELVEPNDYLSRLP